MNTVFLGLAVLVVFGAILFTGQGFGTSLNSTSDVNDIGTLKISDLSDLTLLEMDLGSSDDITSITFTFKTNVANNDTVNISLKDNSGTEIGAGSKTVSPASSVVTITLSDSVTSMERGTLRTASITIS